MEFVALIDTEGAAPYGFCHPAEKVKAKSAKAALVKVVTAHAKEAAKHQKLSEVDSEAMLKTRLSDMTRVDGGWMAGGTGYATLVIRLTEFKEKR